MRCGLKLACCCWVVWLLVFDFWLFGLLFWCGVDYFISCVGWGVVVGVSVKYLIMLSDVLPVVWELGVNVVDVLLVIGGVEFESCLFSLDLIGDE